MKILVPVKRVIDPYVKIRLNATGTDVESQNIKMVMNPFDEIALEEAVRLKEQGIAQQIIVVSIGHDRCVDTLRQALALGADRAVLIQTEQHYAPLAIAKLLHAWLQNSDAQLILMGKQAIDDDCNQTGQMLATLLNWPQATFASKIQISDDVATVQRECDTGTQTLHLKLPCVITVDLCLNTPRFAKLPDIMRAKSKPFETITAESFALDLSSQIKQKNMVLQTMQRSGTVVANVAELLEKLRGEKLI